MVYCLKAFVYSSCDSRHYLWPTRQGPESPCEFYRFTKVDSIINNGNQTHPKLK